MRQLIVDQRCREYGGNRPHDELMQTRYPLPLRRRTQHTKILISLICLFSFCYTRQSLQVHTYLE